MKGPPIARPPDASDGFVPQRPQRKIGSDSPAGVALANAIAAMNRSGEDDEADYQRALEDLRRKALTVMVEIARETRECDDHDYPARWALVHLASELHHPAALPFLRNLIETPIPPEESPDPHSFSTVAEETILRTTAIEGIGALADERKSAEATDTLWEALKQPSLSLRRAAIQSLYTTAGRSKRVRNRIAALLPEEQRFLIDLKPVDVRDVPQIPRPQRDLSKSGQQGKTEPPPAFPGDVMEDLDERTAPGSED